MNPNTFVLYQNVETRESRTFLSFLHSLFSRVVVEYKTILRNKRNLNIIKFTFKLCPIMCVRINVLFATRKNTIYEILAWINTLINQI